MKNKNMSELENQSAAVQADAISQRIEAVHALHACLPATMTLDKSRAEKAEDALLTPPSSPSSLR